MEAETRAQVSCPLSFAQERLWFLNQLMPDCPAYHIPAAWQLRSSLNLAILEQSLAALIKRHEMLSMTFALVEEQPVQKSAQDTPLHVTLEDLRALPPGQREAALNERLMSAIKRPFDLAQDPLWRPLLFQLEDEVYVLLVILHEIIADEWSVNILERDLMALYTAFAQGDVDPPPLPALPFQYTDYALRQRQHLQGEVLETLLTYWRQSLESAPHVLELPIDAPRPAAQTFWGASHRFPLPVSLWEDIQSLSHQEEATAFMTLLAVFQVLLFRYTQQEDMLVGTPISGRQAETEGVVGPFADTLVLRADVSGNPTFRELIARVRRTCVDAFAHQELPFAQLVEALQPERDFSRNPLVQVLFAFEAASWHPSPMWRMGELEITPMRVERGTTTADLSINLREEVAGLVGEIVYNSDLFSEETISRLAEHYCTLLQGSVANPARRLSDLLMLTEAERQQLLVEWNNTQATYPSTLIHRLFEAQVERTPDAVALVCDGEQLTYAALNRRANQVAHVLQRLGVGPETPVGVLLERSPELVIGLLGVLKAGGAYVPLDPTYPQERLAFILADAQVPIVLTQQRLLSRLPTQGIKVFCLDGNWETPSEAPPLRYTDPEILAYVIYTSGSTGTPKGVCCLHASVVNLLTDFQRREPIMVGEVCSIWTSISFDVSVYEFFAPLIAGGALQLIPEDIRSDSTELFHWLYTHQVSSAYIPPFMLADFARWLEGKTERPPLHRLLVGVEPIQEQVLVSLTQSLPGLHIINGYGPTETTICATLYDVEPTFIGDRRTPIGRPAQNTSIYILDQHLQLVPVGIPGELYIGGAGLARGYLYRPDLTAERFIPAPFGGDRGGRLYKTGDLVRCLPDGNIEFLGRSDHQVKLRGFRIEPGEIEGVLHKHPDVREAVVVAREERGEKRLVAYVVSHQQSGPSSQELRRFLQERLPEYMVPAVFVSLEAIPLGANGKFDRRALPAPEWRTSEREDAYVAPRTPVEELVAQIWMELLDLPRIGIHEHFFTLGGHSLLVIRVLSRLRETFQVEMPLQRFFEVPTIAALCEAIEEIMLAEIMDLSEEEAGRALSKLAGREE